MPDGIHYIAGSSFCGTAVLADIGEETVFQSGFIGSVSGKIHGEYFIVGCGKGISSVVDQLSHGIEVEKLKFTFLLQTPGDSLHVILTGQPVMTT